MFIKIILAIAIIITICTQLLVDTLCTCDQLLSQTDCANVTIQCDWDPQSGCARTACSTFKEINDCIDFTGCAMNDLDECVDFTQCYDFHVKKTGNCTVDIYETCVNSNELDEQELYRCQDAVKIISYTVCENLTSISECNGIQADGQSCDWIDGSCTPYDATRCSGFLTQKNCQARNCKWDTACGAPLCSEITDKQLCTYLRGDQIGTYQICAYNTTSGTCYEAEDLSHLNSDTCLTNSGYTAFWNQTATACELCSSQSSSSILYAISLILSII